MSLETLIDQAILDHIFPGVSVGIVHKHGQPKIRLGGHQTYQKKLPVTPDTIYDLASVTKTVPTSTLALQLHQQGKLNWEQPLHHYFPQLANNYSEEALVKHLLQHTLAYQLPALSSLKDLPPAKLKQDLISAKLRLPPGSSHEYCNTNSILLGWIIEKITGQTLKNLAQNNIFTPLQMNSTSFEPLAQSWITKTAPTEKDAWRKTLLHAKVHDESAWKLQQAGGVVGSAGLFSTTGDLLKYLQDLLQPHSKTLTAESKKWWQQSEQLPNGEEVTWGWEWRPAWAGPHLSETSVGKTGFTGCSIFLDWKKEVGVVILSNAVHPQRPRDRRYLNEFRREVHKEILQTVNTGS